MAFQQEVFELVFGINVSVDGLQLDVVHVVDRLDGLNQPVVGNVVMHREDRLLRKVGESGLRTRRHFSRSAEGRFRLEDDSVVALERHLAVLVDAVEEDADLDVEDVLQDKQEGRNLLSALSGGVDHGRDVEGWLVGVLGLDRDHAGLLKKYEFRNFETRALFSQKYLFI